MFRFSNKQPLALIILDGWGLAPSWGGNAISQAKTHVVDKIWQKYPSTSLHASGEWVGLPKDAPGNSEAGHLNIGAGRVVHQDITIIDNRIADGTFESSPVLKEAVDHAFKNRSRIHVMGLLSDTGIHSHVRHLYVLLEYLKKQQCREVAIHLFSDGRDSDPMSGIELVDQVERKVNEIGLGTIASVTGRFYAMDRDNRWERVSRAYEMFVNGVGERCESAKAAFSTSYAKGFTDEFIEPRLIANKTQNLKTIADNDTVIFFNFRSDRSIELINAFLEANLPQMQRSRVLKNLYFASFAIYGDNLKSKQVFRAEKVDNSLTRLWSEKGYRQFHTAETEKYPHITYFINGGIEKAYKGEDRVMVSSPRGVKTYDRAPEMSAREIANTVIGALRTNLYDGMMINFANADMVGHSGNLTAAIKAVECVDACLGKVLEKITEKNGIAIVTADHGNAEQMVNPITGDPDTEHTTNPVPFIIVSDNPEHQKLNLKRDLSLGSITPTILELTGLDKMETMIAESLIQHTTQ